MKKSVYEGLCSTRIAVLGCLLGLAAINTASAATLVLYDFSSGTTAAERLAATSIDSSLVSSASSFSFIASGANSYNNTFLTQVGGDDGVTGDATGGIFQYGPTSNNGTSWTTSDRLYFTITFSTPVNLTGFSFCNGSAGTGSGGSTNQTGLCGGNGGNNTLPFTSYSLFMAAGNGTTTGGTPLISSQAPNGGLVSTVNVDLTGNPLFEGLSGTYTFYFAASGAFNINRTWKVDNLTLSGVAATSVPVPPALLLISSALVPLMMRRRRR